MNPSRPHSIALSSALIAAAHAHDRKTYRGTPEGGIRKKPMLFHPLAVAALVLRYGGSMIQAEAALIHDGYMGEGVSAEALELARIFDDAILDLPETASWEDRKKAYLTELRSSRVSDAALLVVACEELHELDELLLDLKVDVVAAWKGWPTLPMNVFWYFREVLSVIHARLGKDAQNRALVTHFAARLAELKPIVFP